VGPSIWPLLAAIATISDADLVDVHALGRRLGLDPDHDHLIGWFWPKGTAGGRVMKARRDARSVGSAGARPRHGKPDLVGNAAFMLIEGTGFALAIVVYLYLMSLAPVGRLRRRTRSAAGHFGDGLAAREPHSQYLGRPLGQTTQSAPRSDRADRMSVLGIVPLFIRPSNLPRCTSSGTATPMARSPGCCLASTRRTS
jgi:hypothetical protein